MPGSSSDTYATSSDCAYHVGNVKIEEDLDMQEVEVNVKTEKGISSEEVECVDIKDEEGMYSEEEVDIDTKEEEDVDVKEEVSLEDTV
jgi:coenzyme F420-reducing hydrogenase delta subunit